MMSAKTYSRSMSKPWSMGMVQGGMSPMISTDHLQSYATLINLLRERTIGELWKTYFPRRAIARMKL